MAEFNRNAMFVTLIDHQRIDVGSCLCGWDEWGKSHADHIIKKYEEQVLREKEFENG